MKPWEDPSKFSLRFHRNISQPDHLGTGIPEEGGKWWLAAKIAERNFVKEAQATRVSAATITGSWVALLTHALTREVPAVAKSAWGLPIVVHPLVSHILKTPLDITKSLTSPKECLLLIVDCVVVPPKWYLNWL